MWRRASQSERYLGTDTRWRLAGDRAMILLAGGDVSSTDDDDVSAGLGLKLLREGQPLFFPQVPACTRMQALL